jgi:hypothetical protein
MQIIAGSLMALLFFVAYLHGMKPAAHPRYSHVLLMTAYSALLKGLRFSGPLSVWLPHWQPVRAWIGRPRPRSGAEPGARVDRA